MFSPGPTELLVILGIVLIIFGAKKLPEIGSGLGKGIRGFRKAVSGLEELDALPSDSSKTSASTESPSKEA